MRYLVYPYKVGSKSAKALANILSTIRVRPDGRYRYKDSDIILNWGNSIIPQWIGPEVRILNHPECVGVAANKFLTFQALQLNEIPTLQFTTDRNEAVRWPGTVFCRHKLTGHSGEGIEVIGPHQDLPQAKLYTKGIENHGEYRVHVFKGEVIDYRKKSRKLNEDGSLNEPTEAQNHVRTLGNEWVYRAENLRRLERVEQLAIDAINALDLDFGAVDIIMDENGNVFVLEVNTALGLEDRTLAVYVEALADYARTITNSN